MVAEDTEDEEDGEDGDIYLSAFSVLFVFSVPSLCSG
jgi:hypothetical protein